MTIADRLADITTRFRVKYASTTLDSVAFDSVTGVGIGGSSGIPFVFGAAKLHTDDAAFRATIAKTEQVKGNVLATLRDPTKAGTGSTATAMWTDGRYEDLVELVPGVGPAGDQVYRATVLGLNQGESAPTPELWTSARNCHSVWLYVRRRFQPGFIQIGDGTSSSAVAFNATQGAGYKTGPFASYGYKDPLHGNVTYYGRAGMQGEYNLINLPQGTPQPDGINDTPVAQLGTEWQDNQWRDVIVYIGNTTDSDGIVRVHAAAWQRAVGNNAPYVQLGTTLTGVIGPSSQWTRPTFAGVTPFSLNYNWSRSTDLYYDIWGWAAFDAEQHPDPFKVLS